MGFWDVITGTTPAGIISDTGQKVITGVFDGVSTLIKNFHLSPDEELKANLALGQMQLDTMKVHLEDVQSARQMQMSTQSVIPALLTLIVVTGFFCILLMVIIVGIPTTTEAAGQALFILIGSLVAGFSTVLAFWFGTTKGSQVKDEMIWKSVPAVSAQLSQIPQIPQTPQTPQTN